MTAATPPTPAPDITRPGLPRKLQVEVTAACNLRCRMCIVRYAPPYPRSASMTFERFRDLLDQLPTVEEVVLQGIGEPLLAPDLYRMIEYASARGAVVEFNSNATLLTRAAGERLLDAGLGALHISLDGARAESYEAIRDGARWDVVERNITGFVELMRERGATKPALSLVTVLMRRNLEELPAIVERAAAWGIPDLFVQNLSHDFSDAPSEAFTAIADYVAAESVATLPPDEVERAYAAARAAAERGGVRLRLPALDERAQRVEVGGVAVGCDWPWTGAYSTYDGTVLPCCMVMGAGRVELGRLDAASFVDIWEGEDFRAFRRGLVEGDPHPVCRGCSLYRGRF